MFTRREPYEPRPIRCLELWEHQDWRLKIYGIAYRRPHPRTRLTVAAKNLAARVLPLPGVTPERYGAGFVGVHDGRDANFVFICWWARENELHHLVYIGPTSDPTNLREQPPEEARACVWDLAVLAFERDAWLQTMLRPKDPDLDAYLDRRLSADV